MRNSAKDLTQAIRGDETKKLIDRSVELLKDVQKIEKTRQTDGFSRFQVNDLASRGANLIHSITGSKSVYAENLRNAPKLKSSAGQFLAVAGVLQALHLDLSKGHLVNIRHEVEAVVVSEILTQARKLLRTKDVHPAAAVIVACAAVEEFLRNWCEEKGISCSRETKIDFQVCAGVESKQSHRPSCRTSHCIVG